MRHNYTENNILIFLLFLIKTMPLTNRQATKMKTQTELSFQKKKKRTFENLLPFGKFVDVALLATFLNLFFVLQDESLSFLLCYHLMEIYQGLLHYVILSVST